MHLLDTTISSWIFLPGWELFFKEIICSQARETIFSFRIHIISFCLFFLKGFNAHCSEQEITKVVSLSKMENSSVSMQL